MTLMVEETLINVTSLLDLAGLYARPFFLPERQFPAVVPRVRRYYPIAARPLRITSNASSCGPPDGRDRRPSEPSNRRVKTLSAHHPGARPSIVHLRHRARAFTRQLWSGHRMPARPVSFLPRHRAGPWSVHCAYPARRSADNCPQGIRSPFKKPGDVARPPRPWRKLAI